MSTYPDYADSRNSGTWVNRWLVVALIIVLAVLAWRTFDFGSRGPVHDPDAPLRVQAPAGDLAADERATISLFKAAKPSVVNITTTAVRRDRFTLNPVEIPQGTGSGFVWTRNQDGTTYIVTNYHVIQDASRALVTLADDSNDASYNAEYVGGDPDNDLACFRFAPRRSCPPYRWGNRAIWKSAKKCSPSATPSGWTIR
jgi:S1-C subfamily serine protease